MPLDLKIEAAIDQPLVVTAHCGGQTVRLESADRLPAASAIRSRPKSSANSSAAWAARTTNFAALEAKIVGQPLAPLSVLGKLRHALTARLDELLAAPAVREWPPPRPPTAPRSRRCVPAERRLLAGRVRAARALP